MRLISIAWGLMLLWIVGTLAYSNLTATQVGKTVVEMLPRLSLGLAIPSSTPPAWPQVFQGPTWTPQECSQATAILKEDRDIHQRWVTALESDGVTAWKRLNPRAPVLTDSARVTAIQGALLQERQWRDTWQTVRDYFEAACNYFKVGPRAPSPWTLAQCEMARDKLGFALNAHSQTLAEALRVGHPVGPTTPDWDRRWVANYQVLLGMAERICK